MINSILRKRLFTSLILLFMTYLMFRYDFFLIFFLIVLGITSLIEFFEIIKKITKNGILAFSFNSFFISYIFLFCFFFYLFLNFIHLKVMIFSLLCTCIASDVGGYIFGKVFKGPKLTKISPNKTISGAVGSLIFSGFVFSFLIFFFTNKFNFFILMIGIVTSVFCQLGDLFFSYLKRKSKIKDTGNFLPGHGGVLDRIDGILLGIPFGFITLILLF